MHNVLIVRQTIQSISTLAKLSISKMTKMSLDNLIISQINNRMTISGFIIRKRTHSDHFVYLYLYASICILLTRARLSRQNENDY
jgi:hypothetical protein